MPKLSAEGLPSAEEEGRVLWRTYKQKELIHRKLPIAVVITPPPPLPRHRRRVPNQKPAYLPTYLYTYLPTYLPTYLYTYLPNYLYYHL